MILRTCWLSDQVSLLDLITSSWSTSLTYLWWWLMLPLRCVLFDSHGSCYPGHGSTFWIWSWCSFILVIHDFCFSWTFAHHVTSFVHCDTHGWIFTQEFTARWNTESAHGHPLREWFLEELMFHNLVQFYSFLWISFENLRNEIFSIITDIHIGRKDVIIQFDPFVSLLDVWCLKWWSSKQQCVDDDSDWPYVSFVWMTCFAAEHLRSDVIGSSTYGSFLLAIEHDSCGKAEVTYLELHVLTQEQVSKLQIPVYNLVGMHVFDCRNQLCHITLDLYICEPAPSLDHVVETQIGTQF